MAISKQQALDLGMTHEGRICGLACYMRYPESNNPDIVLKHPALQFWPDLYSFVLDVYCQILPSNKVVEFPIRPGRRIAVR